MLGLVTAHTASDNILHAIKRAYHCKSPPSELFVLAWAQTSHAVAEHMRMVNTEKLQAVVVNGAVRESFWTSLPRSRPARLEVPSPTLCHRSWPNAKPP